MGAYAEATDIEPLKVHVTNLPEPAAKTGYKNCRQSVYQTFTLTANDPVQQILEPSDKRVCAWVAAADQDIVLVKQKGEGQTNRNAGDSTLANPTGTLVKRVQDNGPLWPVDDTGEVWAAASVYPARVSVSAVYEP